TLGTHPWSRLPRQREGAHRGRTVGARRPAWADGVVRTLPRTPAVGAGARRGQGARSAGGGDRRTRRDPGAAGATAHVGCRLNKPGMTICPLPHGFFAIG